MSAYSKFEVNQISRLSASVQKPQKTKEGANRWTEKAIPTPPPQLHWMWTITLKVMTLYEVKKMKARTPMINTDRTFIGEADQAMDVWKPYLRGSV